MTGRGYHGFGMEILETKRFKSFGVGTNIKLYQTNMELYLPLFLHRLRRSCCERRCCGWSRRGRSWAGSSCPGTSGSMAKIMVSMSHRYNDGGRDNWFQSRVIPDIRPFLYPISGRISAWPDNRINCWTNDTNFEKANFFLFSASTRNVGRFYEN